MDEAPTLMTQADITALLFNAGALGGDYDAAFNRVRTWHKRGKLPPPTARRPNGRPLWADDVVDAWAAEIMEGA